MENFHLGSFINLWFEVSGVQQGEPCPLNGENHVYTLKAIKAEDVKRAEEDVKEFGKKFLYNQVDKELRIKIYHNGEATESEDSGHAT